MKRHDFESTSKKNAKEQTPEMAEREQEILMWMGDIRDDFILEAEDYKHYQSDKSVPGYFIVGGTLAAAAAICTAIFFQTGRNRIDHSNVPMQLPYQTEETKEIEWETEEETTEEELLALVEKLNADDTVNGILVQLPLPSHINEDKVIQTISPKKDVDGFHPQSVGALSIGQPGFVSCTPAGIIQLLKRSGVVIDGKECVIVGRSNIVGKPMAMLRLLFATVIQKI